jgi:hypothetical protein
LIVPINHDRLELFFVGIAVVTAKHKLTILELYPNKCLRTTDIAAVRGSESWQ